MRGSDDSDAFPLVVMPSSVPGAAPFVSYGLTKREYFAAMAFAGMCANPDISRDANKKRIGPADLRDSFAESSVHCANALIAALNEVKP